MMHDALSNTFIHTITKTYGDRGKQWLAHLPLLIDQCAQEWGLTDLKTFPNLTYNYVLSGKQSITPIVLKLRCDQAELEHEVAALKAFEKYGGVRVLAYAWQQGAVLLEHLLPGHLLETLFPHRDQEATHLSIQLLKRVHQASLPSGHVFPTLDQFMPDLSQDAKELWPFLARARALRKQLLEQPSSPVLLHGDFHQGNIVSAGDEWVVIDPQGAIGNPLYDVAVYLRNPLKQLVQQPNAKELITDRICQVAQAFECDAQTVVDWAYLQATSSAYWSVQDGLTVDNHVAFLTLLGDL